MSQTITSQTFPVKACAWTFYLWFRLRVHNVCVIQTEEIRRGSESFRWILSGSTDLGLMNDAWQEGNSWTC